ncbi:MAG: hypothetical protein JW395_3697 [Nitrospira sp.]|nr:hypothetical protein [Nitrospira sp.]
MPKSLLKQTSMKSGGESKMPKGGGSSPTTSKRSSLQRLPGLVDQYVNVGPGVMR